MLGDELAVKQAENLLFGNSFGEVEVVIFQRLARWQFGPLNPPLQSLLPALREARIANTWAGYIDSTPDGVPGIGELPQVPGLILAAGFSGHGFGIGPGAGHLIADLVSGAKPIFDPAPFNPARFKESMWGKVADF